MAIIFGPTLIWDSKASLQSNLVDNPEKIRIIESFILYVCLLFFIGISSLDNFESTAKILIRLNHRVTKFLFFIFQKKCFNFMKQLQ